MPNHPLTVKPLALATLFLASLPISAFACGVTDKPPVKKIPSNYIAASNNQCLIYKFLQDDAVKSVTWTGKCKDGYASGHGIATWFDGENKPILRVDTELDHGDMNKKAIMDWEQENGCEYKHMETDMRDNKQRGHAVIEFTDGNKYVGESNDPNVPNKGVFTWGKGSQWSGDRYEGQFLNGVRDGYGVYKSGIYTDWVNQGIDFKTAKFNNPTDFDDYEGFRYEGQWKAGNKDGKGKFYSKDFNYEGDWVDDQKNGNGVGYWPGKKATYEGQWKNDQPNGKGKLTTEELRYEGDFIDGNRHGHGVYYLYKENSKYEGEWKDDQTNGKGMLTRNDDKWYQWYQGDFQHSKISGKGELHLASGTVAVGSFIGGYVWGFNTVTVPKPAYDNPKAKRTPSLGKWVDPNTYVEQGWFFNDKLVFNCKSEQDCYKIAKTDPVKNKFIKDTEKKREYFELNSTLD